MIFGLLVSVPFIVFGSQIILKLLDRFPIIILPGGVLLGWIAGTMAVTDPALAGWITPTWEIKYAVAISGALLVLALGVWMNRRQRARPETGGEAGAP